MIAFSEHSSEPYLTILLFLTAVIVIGGACWLAYRALMRWRAQRQREQNKPLRVGLPSLEDFALSEEIGQAFRSFMSDVMTEVGHRLHRRVEVIELPAAEYEAALANKKVDAFVLDGTQAARASDKVDTVACYTTALSSLALVFWDKMPYHVQSLQDFSCYPYNSTVVVGDSLEEHYLSMFDSIRARRVESITDLILQLKLGLVRAGLMRIEHVHCLKREYGNLKYVPVSLQKDCLIQDEKIGVARGNQDLLVALEHTLAKMRRDDTVRRLHTKWFGI